LINLALSQSYKKTIYN